LKNFSLGFRAPFLALPYIWRHRLFLHTAAAVAIHAVLVARLFFGLFFFFWPLLKDLQGLLSTLGQGRPWLSAILGGVGFLILGLGAVLLTLAAGVLTLVLGRVLAGPFLDLLSERVEEIETGVKAPAFSVGRLARGVLLSGLDLVPSLIIFAFFQMALWLIGFIPLVGAPASTALSLSGGALFLAHEFLGFTLMRRFVPWADRWAYVFQHKALSLGLGASCLLLLWVPFVNLMLLPLCAVGGTLAICRTKGLSETQGLWKS
jgi:CysZ protein